MIFGAKNDFCDSIVQLLSYLVLAPFLAWAIQKTARTRLAAIGFTIPRFRRVLLPTLLFTLEFAVISASIYTAMQKFVGVHVQSPALLLKASSPKPNDFTALMIAFVILGRLSRKDDGRLRFRLTLTNGDSNEWETYEAIVPADARDEMTRLGCRAYHANFAKVQAAN